MIGLGLLLEDFKEGLRKKESGLDWMLSGSRGNVLIFMWEEEREVLLLPRKQ